MVEHTRDVTKSHSLQAIAPVGDRTIRRTRLRHIKSPLLIIVLPKHILFPEVAGKGALANHCVPTSILSPQ